MSGLWGLPHGDQPTEGGAVLSVCVGPACAGSAHTRGSGSPLSGGAGTPVARRLHVFWLGSRCSVSSQRTGVRWVMCRDSSPVRDQWDSPWAWHALGPGNLWRLPRRTFRSSPDSTGTRNLGCPVLLDSESPKPSPNPEGNVGALSTGKVSSFRDGCAWAFQ